MIPTGRATAAQDTPSSDAPLAAFDDANSATGLMRRYAAGRVSHFLSRQILTLSGTASLMLIASPLVGLIAVTLALVGELTDCALLRRLPRRLDAGADPARLRVLTTATAAFQALTIAACVAVAWFSAPPGQAAFFCIAYLSGAALNAGIVLPFHPQAAAARLGIYGVTGFALYAYDLATAAALLPRHGYDLMALLIMAYLVNVFVAFVVSSHRRNHDRSREMLVQQVQLADTSASLARRDAEAKRLSLVARTARDSVILTDGDGRITWVNEAFTDITGYSLDDAFGQHPGDLLNGPDTDKTTIAYIARRISAGKSLRAEVLNYTKSGQKIWVETHIVPVPAKDGEDHVTISVERDITRAKRDAERLAEATRSAHAANRAKSEFLATMSHEIRTPMNGVLGMAELLAETDLNTDQRLYARTIKSSATALLTIINDILDLSRLEAGRMTVDPAPVALAPCLEEVMAILSPQAEKKGLTLALDMGPNLPEAGVTDGGRLRQIVTNLVGNAVKFTEQGGVTLRARNADPGNLRIEVEDTGIGIAGDKLATVFESFSQEDGSITRRFGGTGLGLTISRQFAQLLGGDITVTSDPGHGSCFALTIAFPPCAAPVAEPDILPSALPGPALDTAPEVLVAEDNRTNRLLIERYLRDAPCRLRFAEDGAKAVESVRRAPPDLIFMDMSMPHMNGLEATRAIRATSLDRQPVIVALTANAFDDDRAACIDAGMDDFLTKPIRKADLVARIAALPPPDAAHPE